MSCAICLEDLKDARKTQCGHIFCRECIYDWINEEDYYGCKKKSCPLCRTNIGVLSRVNIKIKKTEKKAPKRIYRTRYAVSRENVKKLLDGWNIDNIGTTEELWEISKKILKEGKVFLCHNKSMRETFNKKMREFAEYDEKFLSLIKN